MHEGWVAIHLIQTVLLLITAIVSILNLWRSNTNADNIQAIRMKLRLMGLRLATEEEKEEYQITTGNTNVVPEE